MIRDLFWWCVDTLYLQYVQRRLRKWLRQECKRLLEGKRVGGFDRAEVSAELARGLMNKIPKGYEIAATPQKPGGHRL